MLSQKFKINHDDVSFFRKHGFVMLRSIFSQETVDHMASLSRPAVVAPADNYGAGFSKLKYDIGNDDPYVLGLMKDERFAAAMSELTGQKLFFTQGLGFELEKNKSTGFPWHVGTQSFGFQRLEDYACTIWTPLCRINTKGQRGGMAYVPKDVLSGAFIYQHINMLPDYIKAKIESGEPYGFAEFDALKNDVLNSPAMSELLEFYAVEDDFEVGDALLFDKYVLHKSIKLGEGPIASRLAYALRFCSVEARYDQKRVAALQTPRRLFNYDVGSDFNEIVCSRDGERVFDSPYFDQTREKRTVSPVSPRVPEKRRVPATTEVA